MDGAVYMPAGERRRPTTGRQQLDAVREGKQGSLYQRGRYACCSCPGECGEAIHVALFLRLL